jgi:hypothetical protein
MSLLRRFVDSGNTFPDEVDATPLEKPHEVGGFVSSVCLISKPA